MGHKQEQTVREFLDAWGDETRRPDVEKIVSMFAPDGYWELYVPHGPVIRGRESLRREIQRQLGYTEWARCGIERMWSDERSVVTERLDHFGRNGHTVRHALMAVFELDDQTLITAWREYFDLHDLSRQTGTDPARLSGLEQPVEA
ncbi:nuclear transport factor 2 family protein [Azohydromonas lata]|uniref:nuclear transport factor 2 family protein n=1 Tax=Azohydromonas lata TaxID=45677 RepID=UPI0008373A6B|nr:limonene-1,2-epoxide hydrolase family protein [Azohydromonas lata]